MSVGSSYDWRSFARAQNSHTHHDTGRVGIREYGKVHGDKGWMRAHGFGVHCDCLLAVHTWPGLSRIVRQTLLLTSTRDDARIWWRRAHVFVLVNGFRCLIFFVSSVFDLYQWSE